MGSDMGPTAPTKPRTQRSRHLRLPPRPRSASVGRHWLRGHLIELDDPLPDDQVDAIEVIVSELLSNVAKHARASVCVLLFVCLTSQIIVGVADDDPTKLPHPADADSNDTDGRGLRIVDALSDSWWCHVYEPLGVKVVCARFVRHAAVPRQVPAQLQR